MAHVTPEEIQKRFDRLTEIFSGIVTQADEQASQRCPYRDRHDLCTAKFHCRNQHPPEQGTATADSSDEAAPQALACGHNGSFDYRSAWESDPRAVETARRRIERQQHRDAQPDKGA